MPCRPPSCLVEWLGRATHDHTKPLACTRPTLHPDAVAREGKGGEAGPRRALRAGAGRWPRGRGRRGGARNAARGSRRAGAQYRGRHGDTAAVLTRKQITCSRAEATSLRTTPRRSPVRRLWIRLVPRGWTTAAPARSRTPVTEWQACVCGWSVACFGQGAALDRMTPSHARPRYSAGRCPARSTRRARVQRHVTTSGELLREFVGQRRGRDFIKTWPDSRWTVGGGALRERGGRQGIGDAPYCPTPNPLARVLWSKEQRAGHLHEAGL